MNKNFELGILLGSAMICFGVSQNVDHSFGFLMAYLAFSLGLLFRLRD